MTKRVVWCRNVSIVPKGVASIVPKRVESCRNIIRSCRNVSHAETCRVPKRVVACRNLMSCRLTCKTGRVVPKTCRIMLKRVVSCRNVSCPAETCRVVPIYNKDCVECMKSVVSPLTIPRSPWNSHYCNSCVHAWGRHASKATQLPSGRQVAFRSQSAGIRRAHTELAQKRCN